MGFGARHRGGGALISLGARIGGGAFQVALDGPPDGAVVATTLGASVGEDKSCAVGDTEADAVDAEIVGLAAGSSVDTSATAMSPTAKNYRAICFGSCACAGSFLISECFKTV